MKDFQEKNLTEFSEFDLNVKLAAEVQELLFPKSSPLCEWCCMGVKFRMAQGLGGDYFDFITAPDGCQFIMIGDVTGHGLHASVVMSLLYGFIYRASIDREYSRAGAYTMAGAVNSPEKWRHYMHRPLCRARRVGI